MLESLEAGSHDEEVLSGGHRVQQYLGLTSADDFAEQNSEDIFICNLEVFLFRHTLKTLRNLHDGVENLLLTHLTLDVRGA